MHAYRSLRMFIFAPALIWAKSAYAADPPSTAAVLGKLHHSNQAEIEMGKTAQKSGRSKDVKSFGKTLVKDHTAADKKVVALAHAEKIDLAANTPSAEKMDMPSGDDFDTKFAREMLDDHKKDVGEATQARDTTTDDKLKTLLTAMIPTLEKHQSIAQKLVDEDLNPPAK